MLPMSTASHHHHLGPEPYNVARAKALESLLLEKSVIAPNTIDRIIDFFEHDMGPMNGARVVARAWLDPAFKQRLLKNASAAAAEFGYKGAEGEHMVAVENTPEVHNVIVCTLCSCYPWPLLGLPPYWYKDPVYRARMVSEPRKMLREFGCEVPDRVEIRVWDSSAQIRYLVLPQRPAGTEGMTEEQLRSLVTPEAMIGVEMVKAPSA
jgi:nitrile hydratase